MGKITSQPRKHGPPMNYDCLVVDSYATGHFMALVKASHSMAQAVKFGPMAQQNREIDRVLHDPSMCHYHIVTLPEELPVKESEELFESLYQFLNIKPDFIINKNIETELSPRDLKKIAKESDQVGDFAGYLEAVLERQDESLERLKKLEQPVGVLPLVMETKPWKMIDRITERLAP
jgi:anion-transporting  ArsA/GET3 family ATPase